MKKFTENAPMYKAVKQVEDLMVQLGLTLEVSAHGVTFWHGSAKTSAILLETEGEEVANFPSTFEWKLIDFGSYMGYEE